MVSQGIRRQPSARNFHNIYDPTASITASMNRMLSVYGVGIMAIRLSRWSSNARSDRILCYKL